MYTRTINKKISASLNLYPVIILTGPRQVGKSTEAYKFVASHQFSYVSLDDISLRKKALENPELFIQNQGYPLIIDEIQYAPILFEVINSLVNKKRLVGNANGMFILTGSQSFQMMKNVTQSLAGRATILNLSPFSINEIYSCMEQPFVPEKEMVFLEKTKGVDDVFKHIVKGFYPELYKNPNLSSTDFYSNYVATYIDRDVFQIINIKDKLKFHDFMQLLASLTGCELNYHNISKSIGVSAPTIKEWVLVLITSGIVFLLRPYNEISISKRVIKNSKIYFCDTGLAAYLARFSDSYSLSISKYAGNFMETFVVNEILKSYLNNKKDFNGFFYRDNNQNEIDLVLIEDGNLHLIEIKKGVSFDLKDVKGFKQLFNSDFHIKSQCIICNTLENYDLNDDVFVVSVNCI